MQAAVVAPGGIELRRDWPEPVPHPGEAIVRVTYAGICETDLQILRGYMNFQGVLGHEFVGVAETGRHAGRRVVGEINCSCRQCEFCRSGRATHCPMRTVLGILNRDGAFAERLALPEANLHVVPDDVSDVQAVFTEPLAAAFQILEQRPIRPGERVIVLGDGRLGSLCAQVLQRTGAALTVIGKHPRKLSRLARRGIAVERLDEVNLTEGRGWRRTADLVVDATGSASGWETALRLLKPRGTLVLKTTVAGEHQLSLAPLVIDEIQVIGSRCGPFPPALAALANRSVDVETMVDDIYPLAQVAEAFDRANGRDVQKLLIDCRSSRGDR